MRATTITVKGQVTIPVSVREYLKLKAGDKVDFLINKSGVVVMVPAGVDYKTHKDAMKQQSELQNPDIVIRQSAKQKKGK